MNYTQTNKQTPTKINMREEAVLQAEFRDLSDTIQKYCKSLDIFKIDLTSAMKLGTELHHIIENNKINIEDIL